MGCQVLANWFEFAQGFGWIHKQGWEDISSSTASCCGESRWGIVCETGNNALSSGFYSSNDSSGNSSNRNSSTNDSYIVSISLPNNNMSSIENLGDFPGWNSSDLSRVAYIDFSGNNFVGELTMTVPPSLTTFNLMNNNLSGSFDVRGESLESFFVSFNSLDGKLPTNLAQNLPLLQKLRLDQNNIGGTVEVLANLSRLVELYISDNWFSGTLPSFFGAPLRVLHASDNQFDRMNTSLFFHPDLHILTLALNIRNDTGASLSIDWNECSEINKMMRMRETSNKQDGDVAMTATTAADDVRGVIKLIELDLSDNLDLAIISETSPNRRSDVPPFRLEQILQCFAQSENLYTLLLKNCSLNGNLNNFSLIPRALSVFDVSKNNLTFFDPEIVSKTQMMVLDVSDNMFLQLLEQDDEKLSDLGLFSSLVISNTSLKVCFSDSFYDGQALTAVRAVNMRNQENNSCQPPVNMHTFIEKKVINTDNFLYDVSTQLLCPLWRLNLQGFLYLESSLTNFSYCKCDSPFHYFNGALCVPCPDSVSCDNRANTPDLNRSGGAIAVFYPPNHTVKDNYWPMDKRGKLSVSFVAADVSFLYCRHFDVCNTPATSTYSCAKGYNVTSRMCSQCSLNYYSVAEICVPCGQGVAKIILVVVSLVVAIVAIYLAYCYASIIQKSAAWGIWLFFLQTMSTISQRMSTHDPATSFLHDILAFRPWQLECVTDDPAWMIEPRAVLLLGLSLPMVLCGLILGLRYACSSGGLEVNRCGGIRLGFLVMGRGLNLLFMPVLNQLLQISVCTEVAGVSFLTNHPYADCWIPFNTQTELKHVFIFSGFVFVLCVSIMLFIYAVFAKDPQMHFLNSGLKNKKKAKKEYWSLVVLLRRIALSVTVLGLDSRSMPVAPFAMLTVFWALQNIFRPYTRKSDNVFESLSLTVTLGLYFWLVIANLAKEQSPFLPYFYNAGIGLMTAVFLTLIVWEHRGKCSLRFLGCVKWLSDKSAVVRAALTVLISDDLASSSIAVSEADEKAVAASIDRAFSLSKHSIQIERTSLHVNFEASQTLDYFDVDNASHGSTTNGEAFHRLRASLLSQADS